MNREYNKPYVKVTLFEEDIYTDLTKSYEGGEGEGWGNFGEEETQSVEYGLL